MWEEYGYDYSNFWWYKSIKDDIPYHILKRKRIHNLKYYQLVTKKDTLINSTFILKNNVNINRIGVTKELKDILCIKL